MRPDNERRIIPPHERNLPDPEKPGYSKKMLDNLNAQIPLFSPKEAIKAGTLESAERAAAEAGRNFTELDRVRFELAAISGHFIPQIWLKMIDWLKSQDADLAELKGNSRLVKLPENKVPEMLRTKSGPADNAIQNLTEQMENYFVDEWSREIRGKLSDQKFLNGPEGRFFKRYQKLLDRRIALRLVHGSISPEQHLKGTLAQARNIIWTLFRTIPKAYDKEYYKKPDPKEIPGLINNARPLVSAVASSNPIFATALFGTINRGEPNPFQNADSYNTLFFKFSEGLNKEKYLEFKPRLFEILQAQMKRPEFVEQIAATTGCPALYVVGRDERNIVSDFYDWNADLYAKYCLM